MKYIITIIISTLCLHALAQDTLYVMVRVHEVLYFEDSSNEIIDRFDHEGDFQVRVNENDVLLLHLFDKKKHFRDVTMTFNDGLVTHNTYESTSLVLYSEDDWPAFVVDISKPRKNK